MLDTTAITHFVTAQGDCLEVMKDIPDASIDLVLCDLPYGTTACKWDDVIPFAPLWAEYNRVTKSTAAVLLNGSQPFTSALGASNLSMLKYAWVWEKARPTDFLQAKHKPLKGFEDILVFYRERPMYNPQGTTAIDRAVKNTGTKARGRNGSKDNADHSFHGTVTGADENDCYKQTVTDYPRGIIRFAQDSNALHPTQKPVALMEYLIKTYTDEGMLVLDNCMGSGTTGVACMNTKRRFIGIEKDEQYYPAAVDRINAAYRVVNGLQGGKAD
ncbi:MAG: site-specific DNA-methyltransferase [Minisyncoccia bacterium]